jgi:UDP-3-O-[3-hydroxymyristoyl] glucosamine N-acyltransferase
VGAHATLERCTVGEDCLLHSGVRIGQDGFGFAQSGTELIKIPHRGRVVIGNRVEVGANSTIDAGALNDTLVADDVKLDKQVQIAHNVSLGRGVRIAAQSGVAGSTSIGEWCVIGGQVGIAGHLKIAHKCMVAAASGVTKSLEAPGSVVAGVPAVPIAQWRQQMALLALNAKRQKTGSPTGTSAAPATATPAQPATKPAAKPGAKPAAATTPLPTGPDTPNPFVGEVY